MLYFTFKDKPKGLIGNPTDYLCDIAKPSWFEDDFVKEMIMKLDKTECYGMYNMKSAILGPVNCTMLSGGVSALILLYELGDSITVDVKWCGDNCISWIEKIAKKRDIKLCISRGMRFSKDIEGICIDTGHHITNFEEYLDEDEYALDQMQAARERGEVY